MRDPSHPPEKRRTRSTWHNDFFSGHFRTRESVSSLLQLALSPEELELFDLDTVRVESGNLTDAASLRGIHSELVASVRLKDGEQLTVSVVVEHKSYPYSQVMSQILWYVARLYKDGARVVLPILIYHGRKPWRRKKSFHAFQHASLPGEFMACFSQRLVDFEAIELSLREPGMEGRLSELPLVERVVLRVMSEIWEADASNYAQWMDEIRVLPHSQQRELSASLREYFVNVSKVNKMTVVRKVREMHLGDEYMQHELELLEDLSNETVDSAARKGRKIGLEQGRRETAYETAKRLIQLGSSDEFIREATLLSAEEISKIKNGS